MRYLTVAEAAPYFNKSPSKADLIGLCAFRATRSLAADISSRRRPLERRLVPRPPTNRRPTKRRLASTWTNRNPPPSGLLRPPARPARYPPIRLPAQPVRRLRKTLFLLSGLYDKDLRCVSPSRRPEHQVHPPAQRHPGRIRRRPPSHPHSHLRWTRGPGGRRCRGRKGSPEQLADRIRPDRHHGPLPRVQQPQLLLLYFDKTTKY
mmetsp:Transcript_18242/g.58824  ORF Transcript_18242/g.58824 Transcript_18242/m.58824 type:complete len:206 (-) Transcript_18242:448-1065(-)